MKRSAAIVASLLLYGCGGGGAQPDAINTAATQAIPASPSPAIPVTAATPASTPTTAHPGWTLVWSDEFDIDGLPDSSKWSFDTARNLAGWYNNEKQYYSANRLENTRIQGGNLTITARKESLTSAADYGGQAYTSARLITRGKPSASWTYGLMEVRAKLPCGLGTWPAIWMLGTGGVWPDDGEIDIMEQKGFSTAEKARVSGTIHTKAYNYSGGSLGVGQGSSTTVADACTAFHTYQLTWDKDKLVIGVDNANYFTYPKPANANYATWPFDKPQYLILNLAMGGDLGGTVPSNFASDQMVVDYVRVYQR